MKFLKQHTVYLPALLAEIGVTTSAAAWAGSWSGYLVDNSCKKSLGTDTGKIKAHPSSCSLMPACRSAGYSIFADGTWLTLDKNGNELAEKALESTKTKEGFYATVDGEREGDTIKVTKVSETSAK